MRVRCENDLSGSNGSRSSVQLPQPQFVCLRVKLACSSALIKPHTSACESFPAQLRVQLAHRKPMAEERALNASKVLLLEHQALPLLFLQDEVVRDYKRSLSRNGAQQAVPYSMSAIRGCRDLLRRGDLEGMRVSKSGRRPVNPCDIPEFTSQTAEFTSKPMPCPKCSLFVCPT